jgi:hypothetical protein
MNAHSRSAHLDPRRLRLPTRLARASAALTLVTLAVGCDSNPAPPAALSARSVASTAPSSSMPSPPSPNATTSTSSPVELPETSIRWKAPDRWKLVPSPSRMRLATYRVGEDDAAELTVTRAGGDVASNVRRWHGQFGDQGEPKTTSREQGGLKITLVELEGTYQGMAMPGAASEPKPDSALLGAIVEKAGDDSHFFKLVGSKSSIERARAEFEGLVLSVTTR